MDRSRSSSRGNTPVADVVVPQGEIALPLANAMPENIYAFVPQQVNAHQGPIAQPNNRALYPKLPKDFHKRKDSLTETFLMVLNIALDFLYNRLDEQNLHRLLFVNLEGSHEALLPVGDQEIYEIIMAIRNENGNQITEDIANELKNRILDYFSRRYAADNQPCANNVVIIQTTSGLKAKLKDREGCAIMGGKKSRKYRSKKSRKSRRRARR